ncbi:MAG: hypothetical protein ACKVOB_00385 [Sphingomonas sp.]
MPGSIMASLIAIPGIRDWRLRWALVGMALFVCGLLTLYPTQYRASALLAPASLADIGLGGTLGQPLAVTSIFGVKAPAEVGLAIARSAPVRARAARLLCIAPARQEANVIVRSARGGLVLVEARDASANNALALVASHVAAMRVELAALSLRERSRARASWLLIDPPHVDVGRPINSRPLAVGALILLLATVMEVYRRRPPLGVRTAR